MELVRKLRLRLSILGRFEEEILLESVRLLEDIGSPSVGESCGKLLLFSLFY
jgi:hypothetical protein